MMAYLRRPTDLSSLVFFRIMAGLLLSGELLFALSLGDFQEYSHPGYHFHYQWFPWIKPFSETGMKLLFSATISAGVFVSLGLFYRLMSAILFFGYLALFLMEATQYVNHLYLYCLVAFWMTLLPLHRNGSLDSWIFPDKRASQLPLWVLHLFQFQLAVVYFYAGIAKLHPDWLSGRMMGLFLSSRGIMYNDLPFLMAMGGLFFDLLIVPLLLYRKTRIFAFAVAIVFHLINVALFGLGTFPWFALVMTTLFFRPDWPRKIPVLKNIFFPGSFFDRTQRPLLILVSFYVIVQLLLPLRQHLYPHDASWSEEGHNFSWRMKTRTKRGAISYVVENVDTGHSWRINPRDYVTETQFRDLTGNPEFILQFAHFLREKFARRGMVVSVYAQARTSLNGYPYETIVDPSRDLAREEAGLSAYSWIKKRGAFSGYTAGVGYRASRSGHRVFRRSAQSDAALEAQAPPP